MPGPQTTLLIEGTFKELIEEIADYIDTLNKTSSGSDSGSVVRSTVDPLLSSYVAAEESGDADDVESARDDVLKPVVQASGALNTAPEREFVAAYNLLIHLVHLSPNVNQYLQSICRNLMSDIPSATSPANRFGLALGVLSTVFNVLPEDDSVRYPVFSAILDIISKSGTYEHLRPQLKYLEGWLQQWGVNAQNQRRLLLRVSTLAREAGEEAEAYEYQIRALRTVATKEAAGDEARKLSVEALRTALNSASHFDFEDLASLDSVQALRNSEPTWFELLEVFTSQMLDDFVDFKDEHDGWVEEQELDDLALTRKMRLLTLASLAASSSAGQSRVLPYSNIAKALQIPSEDVEMWVIDVIRAGLVEGKLSQLNKTFLIHRSTYRVFTQTQWREVAGRLDMWRRSLVNVLGVIRQEKENAAVQKEQEARAAEAKLNGLNNTDGSAGGGGGSGGGFRGFGGARRNQDRQQQQGSATTAAAALQREPIDVGLD